MLAESSSENISSSSWGNNNTIDLEDVAGVPSTTSSSNANVNQPHKKQRKVYNRRKEKGKLNPNLGPISNNGNGTGGSGALALYLSSRRTMCIPWKSRTWIGPWGSRCSMSIHGSKLGSRTSWIQRRIGGNMCISWSFPSSWWGDITLIRYLRFGSFQNWGVGAGIASLLFDKSNYQPF